MRKAETVLAIIHECGKRGLPLEDVYRQLFNPDLFLLAYGRIYPYIKHGQHCPADRQNVYRKPKILVCVGAATTKKLVFSRHESRTDTKAGQCCL